MYKIYINETLLILAAQSEVRVPEKNDESDIIARYAGKPKFLLNYIDLAEKTSVYKTITIYSPNIKKLRQDFQSLFKIVKAAGGLVINNKSEALLIHRRGFWDLPKGKMELNEKKKQSALREVMEETGVKNLEINKKLITTYHTYRNINKKRVLKKTFWYLMSAKKQDLVPQKEEGIKRAVWKDVDTFMDNKPKIFRNIRDILAHYKEITETANL